MWTTLVFSTLLISLVQAQNRCALEPDAGPCKGKITRYFYNPQSKNCETFRYGGCQGVVPFETLDQCLGARCTPCTQKPQAGPCEGRFKRWFFHNRRGTCEPFIWGGCDGTVPFEDARACETANCEPIVRPRSSPRPLQTRCNLVPDRGPCLENKTRWYWDAASQECKSFEHGGCFGRVPFRQLSQCIAANCGGDSDDTPGDDVDAGDDDMSDDDDMVDDDSADDDTLGDEDTSGDDSAGDGDADDDNAGTDAICRATPDPGPCEGSFPRWYYNRETDSCESFLYGGCEGSAPFGTRTECEASGCIQNRCTLEPERGPCDEDLTRYYFNQETGRCDSFSYGGCFGIVPFKTMSECAQAKCVSNGCGLLPERGECDKNETRWWYDTSRGECTTFSWGGCGGVVPFNDEKECVNAKCERDPCKLVPDSGICRAFFQRWFWNQEFGRCERFIWGGCGGVVPFVSEMECEDALCAGADFGNNDNSFSMA